MWAWIDATSYCTTPERERSCAVQDNFHTVHLAILVKTIYVRYLIIPRNLGVHVNCNTHPESLLRPDMKEPANLTSLNHQTWLTMGRLFQLMKQPERAVACYEAALRHGPHSRETLALIAGLCRALEMYAKAAEYYGHILKIHDQNGEVWGSLGHCHLMLDDLPQAYHAYQQALFHLPNPKVFSSDPGPQALVRHRHLV